ncbi:MAG: molybdopterin-guanine dinucleotide biosynthesis protein B [Candidatus Desantisbacteria bacterium]
MIPIISIVGRKNSGKTTLIEGVVAELKKRGYHIATIKHDVHGISHEDVDRKGTDTWRHQLSGAETVILAAPNRLMLVKELNGALSLDEIRGICLADYRLPAYELDLILTEGYKAENKPKIEVFRHFRQEIAGEEGLLCSQEKDNLVAVVSDRKFDLEIPCLGLNDYSGIADFLEKEFICPRQDSDIELVVDQKDIYLKGFAAGFLKKAILGMISSLKGVPECPEEVRIRMRSVS